MGALLSRLGGYSDALHRGLAGPWPSRLHVCRHHGNNTGDNDKDKDTDTDNDTTTTSTTNNNNDNNHTTTN